MAMSAPIIIVALTFRLSWRMKVPFTNILAYLNYYMPVQDKTSILPFKYLRYRTGKQAKCYEKSMKRKRTPPLSLFEGS